ncbi:Protein MAIN-LIKE 2 [Glycine soja]
MNDAQTLKATIGVLLGTPSSSCKKMELLLLFFFKKKTLHSPSLPPSCVGLLLPPSHHFFIFFLTSTSFVLLPHPSPHITRVLASHLTLVSKKLHRQHPSSSSFTSRLTGSPCSTTAPPLVLSSPGKLRVVFSLGASALSRHLQFMVRTRGLGHALGDVTGRGVGKGDLPVTVVDDEPVVLVTEANGASVEVDVYADKPMAGGDVRDTRADTPANTDAQAVEDEPKGFPGDPSDPSVLTEYADHVAGSVWTGEERPELKLSSHGRKVHSLGRPVPAIEGLRWHRETSSFHLPMREVTITLDDAVQMLVELLMVTAEAARAETGQCRGPYVRLQWIRDIYQRRCQARHWTAAARTFHLHLLGCTLFANKSATHCWIYEHFPSIAESTVDPNYDEDSPRACSWIATKKTVKSIRTLMYRERLDRLRISDVCWIPYGEHRPVQDFHMISCYSGLLRWGLVFVYYRSERFGYTQTSPAPPVDSWVLFDDTHDRWMHYSDHMAATCDICVLPGQCASDYMDWFFRISHPFMTPGQPSDPLADGHATQPRDPETDIRPITKPAVPSTSARSDVDDPRHAVEACDAIAKRLERHLNLGVVTLGTSTHEVIEECLKIVMSVIKDQLVYVRSRRRRRTDQS